MSAAVRRGAQRRVEGTDLEVELLPVLLLLATADRVPATILANARMCVLQVRAVVRKVQLVQGEKVA